MRDFTITLSKGEVITATLTNMLTQKTVSKRAYKGITAARETLKNDIFVEILKRKGH